VDKNIPNPKTRAEVKASIDINGKMVTQTINSQFEALVAPIKLTSNRNVQVSLCEDYVQSIADGKFDLNRNDPALSAYLDRRLKSRTK
jgi:hypothetical protein